MTAGLQQQKAGAGELFEAPRITYDGLSNMVTDLVAKGKTPQAIILSYRDRRELNQRVMDESAVPLIGDDANKDDMQIAFVQGVMVGWNRQVADGKCIVTFK